MSPRIIDPASESSPSGVLVVQHLRHLVQTRVIHAEPGIEEAQLQPNSLDLRLGRQAHRVRCSFLPGAQGVTETLRAFDADLHAFDLSQPAVLEPNVPYLFELAERLDLPPGLSARANPKSSTGRLDIFARVVTDTGEAFDEIPAGYRGKLFVHVISRSFPVRVRSGDRLVQLRVSRGETRLSDAETRELHTREPLLVDTPEPVIDDGIHFSAALSGDDGGPIGYRARAHTPLLDLANVAGHPTPAFWQVLNADAQRALVLDPDAFYVMASHERVFVPPEVCAEMVPFDAKSGELRTHYAGFFDSGFGKGTGARVVLEIRNRDTPFLLRDRQRIFRFQLHRNLAIPDTLYGDSGSHYQGQALRLAKQFA